MASATAPSQPCWHCKHMISVDARSTIVQCGRAGPVSSFSRGGKNGRDAWEREPGIDDDDWDPPGTPLIAPYKAEQAPQPRGRSRGADGGWTEPPRPRRPAQPTKVVPIVVPTRDPFGGLFNWNDDGWAHGGVKPST